MSRDGRATKLSRELNPDNPQSFTVSPNAAQVGIINALYKTGCWGSTPAEVVRRLFDSACSQHIPKE